MTCLIINCCYISWAWVLALLLNVKDVVKLQEPKAVVQRLWLRGRSAALVQAGYSAVGTVGSKQMLVLQGSATVRKVATVNLNTVEQGDPEGSALCND